MTEAQKALWELVKAIFGMIVSLANFVTLVCATIFFLSALREYYSGDIQNAIFSMTTAIFFLLILNLNKD